MDDLFSVFDKKGKQPAEGGPAVDDTPTASSSNGKHTLTATEKAEPLPKKRKVESVEPEAAKQQQQPVVADSFEQEAQREVTASKGLGGGVGQDAESSGQVTLRHAVRHQVALPVGYDYVSIASHVPPEKPARVYPFTLDPFQQVSVASIQRQYLHIQFIRQMFMIRL